MPNLPAIENSTKPTSWHQFDYIGLLPPWKGQHFGHGFGFPECSVSAKTIIPGFTGCLIYTIVFHIAFLLIKEFPSRKIKCNNWPMVMIIHWSLRVFPVLLPCVSSVHSSGSGSKPLKHGQKSIFQIGIQNTANSVYNLG